MDRRIYFIEAKSPGTHVFSGFPIPRLGTILLATILKAKGYDTKVFIEDVAEPDWKLFDDVPIVGISTITSTANRAYELADSFRAKGKTVIMGGPHPTFMADEALMHADYVVRGEGEETLPELLAAIEKGRPLEGIEGLSFMKGGEAVHNPQREFIKDLGNWPAPDLSLVQGWNKRHIIPVATSRGCPFNCRFCSVIRIFGRKYRLRPVDLIIKELAGLITSSNDFVFFVDDNFAADLARTKELLSRIVSEKLDFEWGAQVRADAARDGKLLELMNHSGCTKVFIGFESVNPRTLEAFNKKQKLDDMIYSIRRFREFGIKIHGMFVLGSDTDRMDTIYRTGEFAREMGLDSIQLLILTPLPGTPLYDEMLADGRLLHTDWSRYDAHHAVYRPMNMSAAELQRGVFHAMSEFYSWGSIMGQLARLNVFGSMTSLYGKRTVKKTSAACEKYLRELEEGRGVFKAGA